MSCFGRKDPVVVVESAKIAMVASGRAEYFKIKFNKHMCKIPCDKTTLIHMLDNNEMCDIYIDNIGNVDVLYEKWVNNREAWIDKSCWLWNHVYAFTIPTVENMIYLEDGKILVISSLDE